MAIRYRKSIRLGGGVRLNVSKSGFGMSAGISGFRVGMGPSGRVTRTISLPGTGLSSRSTIGGGGRGTSRGRTSAGNRGLVSIPAAQALHLLPKPGWLAGAADKRYYAGVQAYLQGDYEKALTAFRACLDAEPRAVSAHLFAALSLGKVEGSDSEQATHLEAVVASADPIPDRLQQKYLPPGFVNLHLGVNITDMISGEAPFDSVGAALMLAEYYQQEGRLEDAIGIVQQLHEADPANQVIRLSLADLYLADGDLEAVLEAASTAANDSDIGVALLQMRGAAMTALGHKDGALTAFTQALAKTAGRDPDLLKVVRYDRALAYDAAGQKAKAKTDLERIYAVDPAFEDVGNRLAALR